MQLLTQKQWWSKRATQTLQMPASRWSINQRHAAYTQRNISMMTRCVPPVHKRQCFDRRGLGTLHVRHSAPPHWSCSPALVTVPGLLQAQTSSSTRFTTTCNGSAAKRGAGASQVERVADVRGVNVRPARGNRHPVKQRKNHNIEHQEEACTAAERWVLLYNRSSKPPLRQTDQLLRQRHAR